VAEVWGNHEYIILPSTRYWAEEKVHGMGVHQQIGVDRSQEAEFKGVVAGH